MHERKHAVYAMNSRHGEGSGNWLVYPQRRANADILLLCFPYAGGSALTFKSWAQRISRRIEIAVVQLPGRDNRLQEGFADNVTEVVLAVGAALRGAPDRPVVLFGHSVGSVLAFEACRWMEAQQWRSLRHLIVAGRPAVHLPRTEPQYHLLSDQLLLQKLRLLNGTPQFILDSPEMVSFFLPRLRADLRLDDIYEFQPGAAVQVPVTAMGGSEDYDASYETLLAWKELCAAGFSCQMFPGGHFFLHSAEDTVVDCVENIVLTAAG